MAYDVLLLCSGYIFRDAVGLTTSNELVIDQTRKQGSLMLSLLMEENNGVYESIIIYIFLQYEKLEHFSPYNFEVC